MKYKIADTVVGKFFFLLNFKCFFIIFKYSEIIWVGSGTRKIQSWIRNKTFRIRNTGLERILTVKLIG